MIGRPKEGAHIYWRYIGSPHNNSGYVVYCNDPKLIRMARWPNDTGGLTVEVSKIEWKPDKNA